MHNTESTARLSRLKTVCCQSNVTYNLQFHSLSIQFDRSNFLKLKKSKLKQTATTLSYKAFASRMHADLRTQHIFIISALDKQKLALMRMKVTRGAVLKSLPCPVITRDES